MDSDSARCTAELVTIWPIFSLVLTGHPNERRFTEGHGPNRQIWGGRGPIIDAQQRYFRFQMSCPLRIEGRSKASGSWKWRSAFAFLITVKIRGGVGEMSSADFRARATSTSERVRYVYVDALYKFTFHHYHHLQPNHC